jgi:hypothetical protein
MVEDQIKAMVVVVHRCLTTITIITIIKAITTNGKTIITTIITTITIKEKIITTIIIITIMIITITIITGMEIKNNSTTMTT